MSLTNFFVYPKYPDNLKRLFTLAYNLWCSWNYEAVNLFYRIDAQRFRAVQHNPVQLLLGLPAERIEALSQDEGFLFELNKVYETTPDNARFPSLRIWGLPLKVQSDKQRQEWNEL